MATRVVTNNFRHHTAEQFFESFSESDFSNFYVFIAKNTPWDDENNPPDALNNVKFVEYDIWKNIIAMKKAAAGSVSYVARRINWESGVVFNSYRDDSDDMWANNYYVVTEDFRIYKCMENNNGGQSTVKPTGELTVPFNTADGYLWKYMAGVSPGDAIKYLSVSWLPVHNLTEDDGGAQWDVQVAAVPGSIDVTTVTTAGSGYWGSNGTVVIANSTTITLEEQSSADGELTGSTIYISGGTGVGQLVEIVNWDGDTNIATVNTALSPVPANTSTYVLSPDVRFRGDGSGARGYAVVSSNTIVKVHMVDRGQDFATVNVYAVANSGSGAVLKGHLSPQGGHGSNIVEELAAFNVMTNVRLEGDEANTFVVNNDFRVIGIVVDPVEDIANTVANTSTYDQTEKLIHGAVTSGPFLRDEWIIGATTNAHAIMVEQADANTIRIVNRTGSFQDGETITGNTSGANAPLLDDMVPSPIRKHSGRIIFVENRSSLNRDSQQTEDLKIVTRF